MLRRGGARKGAGKKPGGGRYGEPTKPMRVPASILAAIQAFIEARASGLTYNEALGYAAHVHFNKVEAMKRGA